MTTLRTYLFHWLTTSFLAILILSLVIFFVGPLIPIGATYPLGGLWTRLIIIAVMFLILGVIALVWLWRRRRRNRDLTDAIDKQEPDDTKLAIDREQEKIQENFRDAMARLSKYQFRSRFGGKRYLYEMPWYLMIGPPGSGKTTALENSGIKFSFRKKGEKVAIRGTRNVEWIPTDEGLFIDTAGKYTVGASEFELEKTAWNSVLDTVVNHRRNEPLNGVIVAVSVVELVESDGDRIDAIAQAVRDRLLEVREKMGVAVPVYVMFTMVDRLVGFNEYFEHLSKDQCDQVWGRTYEPPFSKSKKRKPAGNQLDRFGEHFDQLVERLGEKQFPLVESEDEIDNRALIFGFAAQFSALRPVLERFMETAFSTDRISRPIMLRGFYFTSATQQDQPIDQLLASMANEFGLQRRKIELQPEIGTRSYFVGRLIRDVIIGESGIVLMNRRIRRAAMLRRWAAVGLASLVPLSFGLGWLWVDNHMNAEAKSFSHIVEEYRTDLAGLGINPKAHPVADTDFLGVEKPLTQLQEEMQRLEEADQDSPLFGLGIGGMTELRRLSKLEYERALKVLLRPRVIFSLDRMLLLHRDDPGMLYNTLKAYLMVVGRSPDPDPDFLRPFIMAEIDRLYPAIDPAKRASLDGHLMALLELSTPRDESESITASIDNARAVREINLNPGERAYAILKLVPEVASEPEWVLSEKVRGSPQEVLMRTSGDLDAGIPWLYTYNGFWEGYIQYESDVLQQALSEAWVMDDPDEQSSRRESRIEADARERLRELYVEDYQNHWTRLLREIRVVPFADAADAARKVERLGASNSPYKSLLEQVRKQVQLGGDESGNAGEARRNGMANRLKARLLQRAARAASFGNRALEEAASNMSTDDIDGFIANQEDVGKRISPEIEDHFEPLLAYIADEMEKTLDHLRDLGFLLEEMDQGTAEGVALLSDSQSVRQLQSQVRQAPASVQPMMAEMLEQAEAATTGLLAERLNRIWSDRYYAQCRNALFNKYPFRDGNNVSLEDLSRVLGHGQLLDDFFQSHLSHMVDQVARPWRWKDEFRASIGISEGSLRFFQQADQLRRAFYQSGTGRPDFGFTVTLETRGVSTGAVRVAIGGPEYVFQPTQSRSSRAFPFTWPGTQPSAGVYIGLSPVQPTTVSEQEDTAQVSRGPATEVVMPSHWGLFRLLGQNGSQVRGAGGARWRVQISRGNGLSASLIFDFGGSQSPFSLLGLMGQFNCPARL